MKHALLIGAFLAVTLAACGKKEEAPPAEPPAPAAEPAPMAPADQGAASAPEAAPMATEGEKQE